MKNTECFGNVKKYPLHCVMFVCVVVVVKEISLEERPTELSLEWQWNRN